MFDLSFTVREGNFEAAETPFFLHGTSGSMAAGRRDTDGVIPYCRLSTIAEGKHPAPGCAGTRNDCDSNDSEEAETRKSAAVIKKRSFLGVLKSTIVGKSAWYGDGVGHRRHRSGDKQKLDAPATECTFERRTHFCINDKNSLHLYEGIDMLDQWGRGQDKMTTVKHKSAPTCHKYNTIKRDPVLGVDVAIGFESGAALVFNSMTRHETWFNKDQNVTKSPVTAIEWVPGSETNFLVAHQNGHVYEIDKDVKEKAGENGATNGTRDNSSPTSTFAKTNSTKNSNPISTWPLGPAAINAIAFSPDCKHVAIVNRDGVLRVFDFLTSQLLMAGKGYFGALLCVDWSPDSNYLVTGGEDDLVTVWSFRTKRPVARGEGHHSWVSAVAFDPFAHGNSCDEYRIGSVGQDGLLLLWDFVQKSLVRRRTRSTSIGASAHTLLSASASSERLSAQDAAAALVPLARDALPIMSATISQVVIHEPLSDIRFSFEGLLVISWRAKIARWRRPSMHDDDGSESVFEMVDPLESELSRTETGHSGGRKTANESGGEDMGAAADGSCDV